MSRIGRQPVSVPANVTIDVNEENFVSVKGPKGELSRQFPQSISLDRDEGVINVTRPNDEGKQRALHGLSRSLLNNMVTGVTTGFTKTLEVQGVGYRAQMQGSSLQLALGFSHPIEFKAPAGIKLTAPQPTAITIAGSDKALVGQVAAELRGLRPPEPYKGKGIRYAGEVIRRKAGKAGGK